MAVIRPATGLNPNVTQIYPIVNSIFEQMTGQTDLQAVDTESLVAMGQQIQDMGKLDLWLNSLSRRIGLTIDEYRPYTNKFAILNRTQLEWGAIVQKITAEMPDAVDDKMYDIGRMDGQSVDHYIINNPKVEQKLFDKEAPYSFFITTSTKLLRDAFLSPGAMSSLITQIFGKVNNKIEATLEELARVCMANFMLHMDTAQHYHLVSIYNSRTGRNVTGGIQAMFDADFMRFAVGFMNNIAYKMENMSVQYNKGKKKKFTPADKRVFTILADFMTALETVVQFEAFNPQYVTSKPDIIAPYWQATKRETGMDKSDWSNISSIAGTVGGEECSLENIIGFMFDFEALGTFRQEEDVLTTPVNARAAYYNTFWHEGQLWFNDMNENGVVFFID